MAQRYKFSIESKSFPLDISGEPYVVPCRELSRACQRRVRDCPRMGIIYAIRGLSALSVSAIWGNAKAWTRGMGKERIPRILFYRS